MAALITALVFLQAFGAGVGATAAVASEMSYLRALRNGKIDVAERAHLRRIGTGLRWGMGTLLLSSWGLVVAAYVLQVNPQPALMASYWMLISLALLIVFISALLARRRISYTLGSAIIFTAWWFLAYLVLGWMPAISFGAMIGFFVVAVAFFYALFWYVRFLAPRRG